MKALMIDNNETRISPTANGGILVETINTYRINWFSQYRGWAGVDKGNRRLYIIKEKDIKSLRDDDQTRKKG